METKVNYKTSDEADLKTEKKRRTNLVEAGEEQIQTMLVQARLCAPQELLLDRERNASGPPGVRLDEDAVLSQEGPEELLGQGRHRGTADNRAALTGGGQTAEGGVEQLPQAGIQVSVDKLVGLIDDEEAGRQSSAIFFY